jgi:plastocyanin
MIRSARTMPLLAALTSSLLVLATVLVARAAGTTAPMHTTAAVTIQNFAFTPATLTVAPGTKVVWTNQDSVAHTVTSDTGAWPDSGSLTTGHSFSVTFSKPGTYPYHCSVHPYRKASVVVSNSAMSGGAMGGIVADHDNLPGSGAR